MSFGNNLRWSLTLWVLEICSVKCLKKFSLSFDIVLCMSQKPLSNLISSRVLSLSLSLSALFSWQPNRVLDFRWFRFSSDSPSWYYLLYIYTFPYPNPLIRYLLYVHWWIQFLIFLKNLTFNLCISLFFNS